MGTINCCRPGAITDEPQNEIKTQKKDKNNMKIMTDIENIEEINQFHFNHLNGKLSGNHYSNQENGRVIEVKETSPDLLIDIINSSIEPKSIRLYITPLGLQNSQRRGKNGMTYFGYQTGDNYQESIDYLIKPKNDKYDERFIGLHFYIRFEPLTERYFIKDLCNGFGTFIKITTDILIKHNDLFNIGEDYIVFTLGADNEILMSENYSSRNEDMSHPVLNIKIFSNNINHEVLAFLPQKKRITIGRSSECDVVIEDSMLSRVHCTVISKTGAWYIMDGSIISPNETRNSTNGTWVYPLEEIEIRDKMTFKSNHNLFNCSYIYKSNGDKV